MKSNNRNINRSVLRTLILGLAVVIQAHAGSQEKSSHAFDLEKHKSCHKKVLRANKVITDKLCVKEDAIVCGDLKVKGCIKNLEFQLLKDCAVPPTDEVYNQYQLPGFQIMFANQYILNDIDGFVIPRDNVVPGTEPCPGVPIYGYNEDQTLDLTGGPEKSYNENFQEVNIKYHSIRPSELIVATKDNVQNSYERVVSYFAQRGLPLPGIDLFPEYEGQFLFSNNNTFPPFQGRTVAIKFHFDGGQVPASLDLIAALNDPNYTDLIDRSILIDLFEPDLMARTNGRFYPIRIPITSDIKEFKAKYGKESIVFYNELKRKITIHVPEGTGESRQLSQLVLDIPDCDLDVDTIDKLVSFDGTFNLMRRSPDNQLVSSSFGDLEFLIQASENVSVKTEFIDHGNPTILELDYKFSEPGGVFSGLALAVMNGADPRGDVFVVNFLDFSNAFVNSWDPAVFPGGGSFQLGDNPDTTIVEFLGTPAKVTFWDSTEWQITELELPANVMEGQTTPEENPAVALPSQLPPSDQLTLTTGHELVHGWQSNTGSSFIMPNEGNATGIEMDPKLNNNTLTTFRPRRFTQYTAVAARGDWPLCSPEFDAPSATYGTALWWRFLATQCDCNYQALRRTYDILANETAGPLFSAQGVPSRDFYFNIPNTSNPAGGVLALAQALNEIHGKDLKDLYADFAISMAMIRNNTSIPPQYRHAYPYWLYSPSYPGHQQIATFNGPWATWWQDYQDNIVIPAGYISGFPGLTGQNFVPVLDQDVIDREVQDMTMLMFQIPAGTNSVTVDVAAGEWRLAVVQFTSDGTPVGEFIIDGPHANNGGQTVFDISQFTGSGNIRLVCAHVSINDFGGLNNFCQDGPILTGKISVLPS